MWEAHLRVQRVHIVQVVHIVQMVHAVLAVLTVLTVLAALTAFSPESVPKPVQRLDQDQHGQESTHL